MMLTINRIKILFTLICLTLLGACATPAAPQEVQSEPAETQKPAEKTETNDSTRPSKGEEIDLGLEGGSSGSIVVEESGAGILEENGEAAEGESDCEAREGESEEDRKKRCGPPRGDAEETAE